MDDWRESEWFKTWLKLAKKDAPHIEQLGVWRAIVVDKKIIWIYIKETEIKL